jgi:BASS family bile acid:Na+ symporter
MIERFLIAWLSLLSLAAYYWPVWFSSASDPFAATDGFRKYLFAATMFAIGWMLPRDEIRQVARRWPLVLFGTALQYLAMPLLGWSMGYAFGLSDDARTGLVIVGCVPGAMASNVLTLAARGNVSYSVSLTTASTLLSPLIVPWLLKLTLNQTTAISAWEQSLDLLLTVVLPVVAGHLTSRALAKLEPHARKIGPVFANLTIMWIIAGVVAKNRDNLLLTAALLGALLTVNLLGYAAGYVGGRAMGLTPAMVRALTLEIGMQNAGLGTIVANELFPDQPTVAVPCALYTFGCVLTATVLAQGWRRRDTST